MTVGTKVVQRALGHIGVHSPLQPASPEALEIGRDTLNSMLSGLYDDWGIDLGTVPLDAIGDDLSEPMGARNHIQYMLALQLSIDFPGSQVSQQLKAQADRGLETLKRAYSKVEIPLKVAGTTLPTGQGNKRGGSTRWEPTFYPEGSEIG